MWSVELSLKRPANQHCVWVTALRRSRGGRIALGFFELLLDSRNSARITWLKMTLMFAMMGCIVTRRKLPALVSGATTTASLRSRQFAVLRPTMCALAKRFRLSTTTERGAVFAYRTGDDSGAAASIARAEGVSTLSSNASIPLRRVGSKLSLILAPSKPAPAAARSRNPLRVSSVSKRELAIDASRGAAMLLVCLSHFADGYLFPSGAMGVGKIIKEICLSATPTFVLLSGMMVGYLHAKNPAGFSVVRTKLADRGLFLLSICHLLIALFTSALFGGLAGSCRVFFVTDMLGVALIAVPPLVERWSNRRRALTGVFVYCASSLVSIVWHPHPAAVNAFTEILLGQSADDGTRVLFYTFPLLPWLAIYLTATALGAHVARMLGAGRQLELARQFAMVGLVGLALAADMLLLRRLFDAGLPYAIHQLTSPMVKTPPSPAFICFNLGIGLLVLSAAFAASVRRRSAAVVRAMSLIGQASLFVFVAEYFIYDFALFELHPRYTSAWPLMFVFSIGIIWSLAALWARRGYNRFLTVGYSAVADSRLPVTTKAKPVASAGG